MAQGHARILTIGGVMRDIFIQYEHINTLNVGNDGKNETLVVFEEGRKIEVDALYCHVGGGAANSAVSYARLGLEVSIICMIGSDQDGIFIQQKLRAENVNDTFIAKTDQLQTGTSFIIPTTSGNRVVLVWRGANTALAERDITMQAIDATDYAYCTSMSKINAHLLPYIASHAKAKKKKVAVNPGTGQLTYAAQSVCQALPHIDILILNSYEATLLTAEMGIKTKQNNPHLFFGEFFNLMHTQGIATIVVTNGAEGVYVSHEKKRYFHPSIAPQKIVSTVGAGDAFGSTFVAFLAQQKSLEDAIRAGIINSSSVIEHIGAQTGLLTAEIVYQRMANLDKKLLQIL